MKQVKTFFRLPRGLLVWCLLTAAPSVAAAKKAAPTISATKTGGHDPAKDKASPSAREQKSEAHTGEKKAKRTSLSPEIVANVKQVNVGFKGCQGSSLELMKARKISAKEFKMQVNTCRERFPGASIYVECKKKALKDFASNTSQARAAIGDCKKYLIAASFDPKQQIPFYFHESKVYFAGIGMNKSQSMVDFGLPNFDCSRLTQKSADPKQAEHILFGNHPSWFTKLRGKPEKEIRRILNVTQAVPEDGHYIDNFGRLFGDPTKPEASVFFPSGSCAFAGNLGSSYTGLSSYFLIDKEAKAYTPYFAIAFYKPQVDGPSITTDQITSQVLSMLGEGYAVAFQDNQRTILATDRISKLDDEGDPKDVCRIPRKHKLIVIIKARTAGSKDPEFVLTANVSQLCDYGDRVSRRL